ncbi:nucleoside triphosphate pyrophosphohydrolase [Paenibacillus alginolyticus]|uniref:Nucleoside triphosphate pyrophosphohydrolase n=1 Tax=Paenibacillus alginolyticus TaxID=59839 RepID=A0ABT4GK63_9BACL|nr:nucleoside triphosphate pyrophosphohydrolase [Paenibacillus alginolyticus]MCY9696423.1 nucleoside triphosphate pyrophosphohydrolase [Paenibacillus alginolyticus]MEC0145262.1 nucleoside triphosphate pyrophosphohydrolase [Paenibacillus alginolyticus]
MIRHKKLVRDKIPQVVGEQGKKAEFRVLSDVEYKAVLNLKLHEELLEFINANEDDQITELADLVEVVYGILETKGVSIEDFEKVRLTKKAEYGGFKEKLLLVSVED